MRTCRELSEDEGRAVRAAAALAGQPLDGRMRAEFETRFQTGLDTVRIIAGKAGADVCGALGVQAFSYGNRIFTATGRFPQPHLLAHELTHVLQRGSQPMGERMRMSLPGHRLETEAELVSAAVTRGEKVAVNRQPDCPEVMPAAALAAIAAGTVLVALLWAAMQKSEGPSEEKLKSDSASHPDKYLHEETLVGVVPYWNLVPFVGSFDQSMHGRTRLDRRMGVAFLSLDMLMIGGTVKGVIFVVRGAGRIAALRAAMRGVAREAAANEAGQLLVKSGVELGTQSLVEHAARGPVLVVGSEGWVNHAVSYLILDGKVYKFHGEPWKLFTRTTPMTFNPRVASGMASRMNTMTIYTMNEAAARQGLETILPQMEAPFLRRVLATKGGCGNTQLLVLDAFGQPAGRAAPFVLPVTLDSARLAGPGIHFVHPNAGSRIVAGTSWQSIGMPTLLKGAGLSVQNMGRTSLTDDELQGLGLAALENSSPANPVSGVLVEEISIAQMIAEMLQPETLFPIVWPFRLAYPLKIQPPAPPVPKPKLHGLLLEDEVCRTGMQENGIPGCITERGYRVGPGDTLWAIAQNFYGHRDSWRWIYEKNKAKIRDPNNLPVGVVLTLP